MSHHICEMETHKISLVIIVNNQLKYDDIDDRANMKSTKTKPAVYTTDLQVLPVLLRIQ